MIVIAIPETCLLLLFIAASLILSGTVPLCSPVDFVVLFRFDFVLDFVFLILQPK